MLTVLIGPYESRLALRVKTLGDRHAEEISGEDFSERASSNSLFSEDRSYLIRDVEEDLLLSHASELAASPHLFIYETEKMLAKPAALLKKQGAHVLEAKAQDRAERLNVFALADAFGMRDRKKTWLLFVSLLRAGSKPEEIAGILHWQARSMLVASRTKSADEAKMKEFVFAKARRYANNFTDAERTELSRRLVTLYHESHRGGGPLELLLERFVLSL